MEQFAWFGPLAPPSGFRKVPDGGVCISSFIIVRRGKKILLGKVAKTEDWEEKTGMNAERVAGLRQGNKWIFPSTHLKFGEHPSDAAERIMREQLMVKKCSLTFMGVHSFLAETEIYPGESHWDLCFLYSARLAKNLERSSLFSELDFLDARTLRARDIGRDQETILEVLGLIRK